MNVPASKYYRKSFGLKGEVQGELQAEYESDLITRLRQNGNTLTCGNVTIKLAEAFGFCWGVDRAVSMAYETRRHFPDRRIWITNEIIHNPVVNSKLREMNIDFVPAGCSGKKDFSDVAAGDVVILPAFGASVEEMQLLESKSCEIVDTTCPWVSRVWNRVARYQQEDFTAILHGKYKHEETVATSSRAKHYLIIQNLEEARRVCAYILQGGDRAEFLKRFRAASSAGFDPDKHLVRLGIANQTTMLKGETEQIGKLFEQTMLLKYGTQCLEEHFLSPGDTICNATQERQDAMLQLVDEPLDVILVIGGYNSSNTGHLYEIAAKNGILAYHIDGPKCIGPGNRIAYKVPAQKDPLVADKWLKAGSTIIGVTSGASTPDKVVAEVVERILEIKTDLG
ncbi:MAG: 4-hydroxy-3-methylbut-2-enyl diphosphate reductase [Candidatus Melainabacteria bacterium]|nr:4-hydroxy-3-methylbut-2-enyl diphosphate reductase [Candidatus Melainabacteria bacterium]